ncbi:hypothetical protein PAPYR_1954 [Paratrimastix pyriformis]|uniref:Uncharacterized protein n=1 Tax=Paratrimastix pyriformis TaxID=342808 RepID=A0ABQ8UQF7_9EUKA|nr:hypothetical protein PAPYR_1954 [Paratrimastix pyriformis]
MMNSWRKSVSLLNDVLRPVPPRQDKTAINIRLGDNNLTFRDGEWHSVGVGAAGATDFDRLLQEKRQLEEEKRLLSYKTDLLLDMLTVKTLEVRSLQKEVEQLHDELSSRRRSPSSLLTQTSPPTLARRHQQRSSSARRSSSVGPRAAHT